MYILNEKEYIRDLLASGKKPDNVSNGYLIVLIAKYYFDKEKNPNALIDIVKKKMLAFDIDNYQEYRYANKIQKVCKDLCESNPDNPFRELEYVPIYKEELKVVESLPNDRQKKFVFTLFAIARYMNCDGWINKKDSKGLSEVFKLANVTLTADKRNELLHDLYSNGYISFGKKVNNLNIRINLGEDDDEIVYKVKEFNNIGNQYIGNFKKGYRQCANGCGRNFKASSTGRPRQYCSKCAKLFEAENAVKRKRKQRETENVTKN